MIFAQETLTDEIIVDNFAGGGGVKGVCHESEVVPQSVRGCYTGGVTWSEQTSR